MTPESVKSVEAAILYLLERMERDKASPRGFCYLLDLTQALELQLKALADVRGVSVRAVADDLRRRHLDVAASNAERIADCGPWIDGHRWRATTASIYRDDVDGAPDEKHVRGATEAAVREMLAQERYPVEVLQSARHPGEYAPQSGSFRLKIDINLEPGQFQTVRTRPDQPAPVAYYSGAGEIVAVVMPIGET